MMDAEHDDFSEEVLFFFSSRRRHTRWNCDWSSDVCSSDLPPSASCCSVHPRPHNPVRTGPNKSWACGYRLRLHRPCFARPRSEEHTSELQSQFHLVCRLLLEKKKKHETTK